MNAAQISRINAQTIGCNKGAAGALPVGSAKEIYLFRAYGQCMGLERGETDMGEYYAIMGRFQAENQQEGTETFGHLYESDTLFLPPGGHDSLVNQITNMGVTFDPPNARSKKVIGRINDGKVLNIAVDVYVKRDSNPSGVTYVTKPILETQDDPLEAIRVSIKEAEAMLIAAANGASGQPAQLPSPGEATTQHGKGKR